MSFGLFVLVCIGIYLLFIIIDEEDALWTIVIILVSILMILSIIDLFIGGAIFGDTNGLLYFE